MLTGVALSGIQCVLWLFFFRLLRFSYGIVHLNKIFAFPTQSDLRHI